MDFTATKDNIGTILQIEQQFVIPRFQREYSWEITELEELWEDIMDNITISDNNLIVSEYFIGSLVVIEDTNSTIKRYNVVDGQQRLTTFTILLSVLAQCFIDANEEKLSNLVFKQIVDEDKNANSFCKLISESPKPYFQESVQTYNYQNTDLPEPATAEEKRIEIARKFFQDKLYIDSITNEVEVRFNRTGIEYGNILKAIRDQIYICQVIFVVVNSFAEAYTIFEVLNAKGKSLNSIDLIKNEIFSKLQTEVPLDKANESWKKIKETLHGIKLEDFYRHWWISNYKLTTNEKLYKAFKREIPENEVRYLSLLNDLEIESDLYAKIAFPNIEHWKQPEIKSIYFSLDAFKTFNVKQVRTILLAILSSYKRKKVKPTIALKTIRYLEYFHFIYNAICSKRPSGIEQKYSSYAQKIRNAQSKNKSTQIMNELINSLSTMLPSYKEFQEHFLDFNYQTNNSRSKSLTQYILKTYEFSLSKTVELVPHDFTIEHILANSSQKNEASKLGNLLPLSSSINNALGKAQVQIKIEEYKKSEFKSVDEFISDYVKINKWGKDEINIRTNKIAHALYYNKSFKR